MDDLEKIRLDRINNQATHGMNKSTSLLERILMHTHSMSISHNITTVQHSVDGEKSIVQDETNLVVADDKKICDATKMKEMIDLVINRKLCVSERVEKLKYLIKQCSANDMTDYVISESLSFCGSLLSTYCDPSSKDTEELRMLMPLLSFISNYGERTTVFLRHSDFMYNLMRACVTCVTVFLSKSKELLKITRKKKLAGRVRRVAQEDSLNVLTRAFGVPDFLTNDFPRSNEDTHQIDSFLLSLFDTTTGTTEKDINQYISRMQVPHLPDQNFESELAIGIYSELSCGTTNKEIEEEWTDVGIIGVLPFGEIIAYTKGDWKHWLNLINGELIEFLRFKSDKNDFEDEQVLEVEIGTLVGFWTTEARFPGWKPLIMTRCLRGLVLGRAPSNLLVGEDVSWAIWAMDVGSLVFCNKVWPLPSNLISCPPLTSICSLDLEITGRGKEEQQFLIVALPLLTQLLANKPSAARHMVAYGAGNFEMGLDGPPDSDNLFEGGAFLMLIEYPDSAIRIAFLKLILSLTRNSMEVLRYLLECRFYMVLSKHLEMCVHFCNAASADSSFWLEMRLLLSVLKTMVDGSDKHTTELSGWDCIQRVLIMLTKIEHPRVKFMAAKCLAILESHKINKSMVDSNQSNVFLDGSMAKDKIVGRPCDVEAGSLENKARKSPQSTDSKSKSKCRNLSSEIRTRESVLADTEGPEPLLSVMDVGDLGDDDDECSHLPSVNAMFDVTSRVDYYTRGYKINITNDETHELSLERTPHQISENALAMTICAFLNNGIGGSVYFGINSESTIEGLRLTRIERDNFRKGIDRMMSRSLYPEVRPACYDINYVPVLNPGEKSKGLASHKLWVIELHSKALPHVIYTLASNRKCYVRRGTEYLEGMSISIRQDAAEQNKKEIIRAIQEVKAQIPPIKEKLVLFIQDYLNKIQSPDSDSSVKSCSTISP